MPTKPVSVPTKPGFVPPKPVSVPPKTVSTSPPPPVVGATAASVPASAPVPTSSNMTYEDDPCVICHDEMTISTRNVSLDCGHTFHHDVSII